MERKRRAHADHAQTRVEARRESEQVILVCAASVQQNQSRRALANRLARPDDAMD
ncbi:MAG: hypothetical protein LC737_08565 [Chloroflexi bacterium]|nr:hypothetical protein [Chloroflexota bacterium]